MVNADFREGNDASSADNALDFTAEDRTRRVIAGIFQKMDEEKGPNGSYYDLVPALLRSFVDSLVEINYPKYEEQFQYDRSAFREKMSQNWVAKFRAFPVLAQEAGFFELTQISGPIPAQFISDSLVACLTATSSYVLVGPNSLNRKGKGAHLDYVRLPLREEPSIKNTFLSEGAYLEKVPKIFERLSIVGVAPIITSPVIAIWQKPMISETDRADFNQTMRTGTQTINIKTGFEQR